MTSDKVRAVLASEGASHGHGAAVHVFVVSALISLLGFGCYRGDELEKQPPPGWAGGNCLAPNGTCRDNNICNLEDGAYYCYNPQDPCEGFFCGGSERGACIVDNGLPSCQCREGFDNDLHALYCCPGSAMLDPLCVDDGGTDTSDGDTGESGGTDTSDGETGESSGTDTSGGDTGESGS